MLRPEPDEVLPLDEAGDPDDETDPDPDPDPDVPDIPEVALDV